MASKGNVSLYERYVAAWGRIKSAIEQGFYFEAIAIEESIISNRLTSFLFGIGAMMKREADGTSYVSLGVMITRLRSAAADPKWEDPISLADKLAGWRKHRNTALHALASSFPGKAPKVPLPDFLADVKTTAEEGKALARSVSNWHKRQLTRAGIRP